MGRNDIVRHATFACMPGEERMVFTFYTKWRIVDRYKRLGIGPGHPFFEGPDEQDWSKPPEGWDMAPPPPPEPEPTPRNQGKPEFADGARAMCKDGASQGAVKVLKFYPNGPPLDTVPGPKYKVEWMTPGWKGTVSVVPAGDLSGAARRAAW